MCASPEFADADILLFFDQKPTALFLFLIIRYPWLQLNLLEATFHAASLAIDDTSAIFFMIGQTVVAHPGGFNCIPGGFMLLQMDCLQEQKEPLGKDKSSFIY